MIFGDHVASPDTVAAAEWIAAACRGAWGTVGALLPNQYSMALRVPAPDRPPADWWSAYRELYRTVASIGERHTSSPGQAWFAVWDGHGFEPATSRVERRDPLLDDELCRACDEERAQLRNEDERRDAALRAELRRVPQFDLPHRTYFLLEGAVTAATELRHPGPSLEWRNPDLFWPDDRRWFVATDVDFWALYVGGADDFITELAGNVPTRSEIVPFDRALVLET